MFVVIPPLDIYELQDADSILTPALLIYPEIVDSNISATLRMVGNDANRWRPHIKTAKIAAVLRQLIARGVRSFKRSRRKRCLGRVCRNGC
jgi:D-serine deaminase-like pyridoxal phosphate-dependent protein